MDATQHIPELGIGGILVWLVNRVGALESRIDAIMGGLNLKAPDRKKKWRTPLAVGFIVAAAIAFSGCTSISQGTRQPILLSDGKTVGYVELKNRAVTLFDGKQTLEKLRLSAGKTSTIGVDGLDQVSSNSVPATIQATTQLLEAIRYFTAPVPTVTNK